MKVLLIAGVLLFSGCNIQRWCQERFPPEKIIETHEVVRDSIVVIKIPPDTVQMTDTVTIIKGLVQMPPKRLETEACVAVSWITNSRHYFDLEQKELTVDTIIQFRDRIVKETVTVPEHYITWRDGLWIRIGKIMSVGVFVGVVLWIVKLRFF